MRQGFFRLDLDAFPVENLNIPAQELNPDHCQSIVEAWGMGPTWYQLEDGGKFPQPGPHHSNIGYFLPAQSGLQQLIFDTAFEVRGDESLPLHGRLLIRRAGQWQECWKTSPVPSMYVTNPIVADFDADGQQEVAFTPWYDLWLLDLETGNLEQKCSYKHPQAESGRAYGYLGGHNLFADERLEIVMLSNSELHLDVFGWDENGRLKVIWSRLIQPGVNQKNKRLQIMPNPALDFQLQLGHAAHSG